MSLFQHALQSKHWLPCLPDRQVSDPSVTTLELWDQALPADPSIRAADSLMIILSGTSSGAGRYGRSCVGIQCLVSGVCLATSKILFMCSTLCTSPASCHLNHFMRLICATIASTHNGFFIASSLRYCAALIAGYLT